MRNLWPFFPLSIKYIFVTIFTTQVQNEIYISSSSSSNIFRSHLKLCRCSCCFAYDLYIYESTCLYIKNSHLPHFLMRFNLPLSQSMQYTVSKMLISLVAKVFNNCKDSHLEWSRLSSAILQYSSCLHLYHCTPWYNTGRQLE